MTKVISGLLLAGLAIIVLVVGGGWLLVRESAWQVRANEYFGDGVMWTPTPALPHLPFGKIGEGAFVGVIRGWGWYWIYGTAEDCRIVPLWSPLVDAQAVACGMVFNEKGNRFSGWIHFRGHARPFCGTRYGDFPQKCYGEY